MVELFLGASPPLLHCSSYPPIPRGVSGRTLLKCSLELPSKVLTKHVLSGLAASLIIISPTNQSLAADLSRDHNNICQLASAGDNAVTQLFENESNEKSANQMMMRGMTAKNFDPVRYSGRWFEVASLKRGFAGQGQEDCHCTQGVYTFDREAPAIQVDTFCFHGGPDGYITGIRGRVQCVSQENLEKNETELEKQEMIKEKCFLRFPTLPFIPKLPYDVIATDYDNFALVSGAKDRGFVQIYSRTPNPGTEFIERNKAYLENFGYDPSKIKDTPQDCEVSDSKLSAMMSMSGMQQALTNQFPDIGLKAPIEFNPFTSVFDTFKKLVELYFKR
ncbi:chloroplastic lipocalin [Lotus japonicus]|uniref:chloroplastic lipocalin n=1 Tax=Lotus japonicus TaxID=34305 RepID=UPI002588890F|nr:chloroplastic lipocalin [Lotus japonicus]